MHIDALLFQLAVVFLPGLLWTAIVDKLTVHEPRDAFSVVARSFAFGLAAYGVRYCEYYIIGWGTLPPVFKGLTGAPDIGRLAGVTPRDIVIATLIAFIGGPVWSAGVNRKWFMRVMQRLHVTRKYGDEDVWSFVFNMDSPAVEYVNVRDFQKKIVYSGYVKGFSETPALRELLLENVQIYDLESGRSLFSMPLVCVSNSPDSLHIEFPFRQTAPATEPPPATEPSPAATVATTPTSG